MISDVKLYYEYVGVKFLFHYGFQAIILYRLGHWAFYHLKWINPLWYIYLVLKLFHMLIAKIELPPSCYIGQNLLLPHPYGLVMGGCKIGNNCTIGPWVVIGYKGTDPEYPVIGENVYIGPKATVLGGISIGDNCIIGANTVVEYNLASNSKI